LLFLKWFTAGVLAVFPVLMFAMPKGANIGFYLLLLCSLVALASGYRPMGKSFPTILREYWLIGLSMGGLLLAILLNHLTVGEFPARAYDMPSRLAAFILIFWLFLSLSIENLKNIQWGLVCGTLVCAVIIYIQSKGGVERPSQVLSVPLIPFGNMVLTMGVLAVMSIGWTLSNQRLFVVLKLVAGGAALYATYLSQTRGGWLAIPVFIGIAFILITSIRLRHKVAAVLVALALLAGSYFVGGIVQERIELARSDIVHYFDGTNRDTSVGVRFQLWHGAWELFKENPAFGIGKEQVPQAFKQLEKQNVISPVAAEQPHSHNELLFHMATLGIFGLLALLSLYFVPAFYFWRHAHHCDRDIRTAAAMGLALTLGFFIFGLTDVMFYWRQSYTFYTVIVAVLFACLVKRKAILKRQLEKSELPQ
jgi:O-antigen ligase